MQSQRSLLSSDDSLLLDVREHLAGTNINFDPNQIMALMASLLSRAPQAAASLSGLARCRPLLNAQTTSQALSGHSSAVESIAAFEIYPSVALHGRSSTVAKSSLSGQCRTNYSPGFTYAEEHADDDPRHSLSDAQLSHGVSTCGNCVMAGLGRRGSEGKQHSMVNGSLAPTLAWFNVGEDRVTARSTLAALGTP
jgi:hypothetical protein